MDERKTIRYAKRSGERREPLTAMLPPRIVNYIRNLAARRKESISVVTEELLQEAIFGPSESQESAS